MNRTMKAIATAFTAVLILVFGSLIAVESAVAESGKPQGEFDRPHGKLVQPTLTGAPKALTQTNRN